MPRSTKFIMVILLLAVGACVWFAMPMLRAKTDPKVLKFNDDAENLIVGLQQYKEFTKSYPTGGNVEIAKAITGQTEKFIIVTARRNDLNARGELVDGWGTPLQIYFSGNSILVRSAGPNQSFDDSKSAKSDDLFRSSETIRSR